MLLVALVLAGCAAGPAPASVAADPDVAASTGRWVAGTVVADDLVPIAGALVRETGEDETVNTDAAGRFRLENVTASSTSAVEASHPAFHNSTLRVDLQYVPNAEVRFVLRPLPSQEAYHKTVPTKGEVTCQVAFGSHHGFPGFYRESCAQVLPESKERVMVAVDPGVVAGVIELAWEPQSQFADIMGLSLFLSTQKEEIMIAAVHSLAGDHYVSVYTGMTPVEPAKLLGGVFDTYVHVDPSLVDEHVPTNAGVVIQQTFTLYTTAFYGDPPPPTWSALNQI
jgi:hypothetical protein